MTRISMLAILVAGLSLVGARASFAVGGSVAGHGYGYNTGTPGGVGTSYSPDPSALSHNYGGRGSGLGYSNQAAAPQVNGASTDNHYLTTGGNAHNGGAIGYPRTGVNGHTPTDKNIHGISTSNDFSGGRGF